MQTDNVSIPLSDLKAKLTPFFLNAGVIVKEGNSYKFDQRVLGTVPGLTTSTTYNNQEQAIDAIFRAWFPEYIRRAA